MTEILKWFGEMTPGGVGVWTAVGLIAVALIRQRPITQKLTDEREGNLLKERAADMNAMRRQIAELQADQTVARHTIANLEQCLDALLMMIELNPERAQDAAVKVRAMRESMKQAVATEKAGIIAATIKHAAGAVE